MVDDLLDLSDDMEVFDNLSTLRIDFQTQPTNLNFSTETANVEVETLIIENCLIRDSKSRNSQSVHQVRDRSLQNDVFDKIDVVIEIPFQDALKNLKEGATIFDDEHDRKWKVTSVDFCTLNTRLRVGCIDYV